MCASHLNPNIARKSSCPCEQQGGSESQAKTELLHKHAEFDFETWDYSIVSAGAYPERLSSGDRQCIFCEYERFQFHLLRVVSVITA